MLNIPKYLQHQTRKAFVLGKHTKPLIDRYLPVYIFRKGKKVDMAYKDVHA